MKAFDINPLISLEMQHNYTGCFTSSYVNPRLNKEIRNAKAVNESLFINIALRDRIHILKLRVIKVVHAFIHRKVFIFYSRENIF